MAYVIRVKRHEGHPNEHQTYWLYMRKSTAFTWVRLRQNGKPYWPLSTIYIRDEARIFKTKASAVQVLVEGAVQEEAFSRFGAEAEVVPVPKGWK